MLADVTSCAIHGEQGSATAGTIECVREFLAASNSAASITAPIEMLSRISEEADGRAKRME
jgi:hypothetical protein